MISTNAILSYHISNRWCRSWYPNGTIRAIISWQMKYKTVIEHSIMSSSFEVTYL